MIVHGDALSNVKAHAAMSIGNITSDDIPQIIAIGFCLSSLAFWLVAVRRTSSPLYFLPPIIASGLTLAFYLVVSFVKMSIETATTLSAATRLADMMMWTISGAAMAYVLRRNGRLRV